MIKICNLKKYFGETPVLNDVQLEIEQGETMVIIGPSGCGKSVLLKNIIGILLPATPFSLMMNEYANARYMIDIGIPIAIATDLNPNCWVENMQFIIQLACLKMKMTPAEAITASTFNAACTLGLNDFIGSLEVGKRADLIILDCPNYMFIPYHLGINLVDIVIKNGKIINF